MAATRDEPEEALEWFLQARTRSARLPDGYRWVDGYILDALCEFALAHDLPGSPGWIEQLGALAARTGMRELAVRAYLHRARGGDDSALAAARMLAAGIDNPALGTLLTPRHDRAAR